MSWSHRHTVNHHQGNRTDELKASKIALLFVAPLIGAFVFFAGPTDAFAASYCGQTTGVEQGGIAGNQATITITSLSDQQHVTNPNVIVTGVALSSPMGRSLWGVPDTNTSTCTTSPDGNDIVDSGEINNVNMELNGVYVGNCSDQQVGCTKNAAWSRADYSKVLTLRPGPNNIRVSAVHGYNQWIAQRCNAAPFRLGIGYACQLGTRAAPAIKIITVHYDPPPVGIPDGQIIGRCLGWPNPHVEIEWSRKQPPGQPAPDSNSILRSIDTVNGGGAWWMYGGGPQIASTRINGSYAAPGGFSVYDLRDDSVTNFKGSTFTYKVKYRPATPSSNVYSVLINAANCGGAGPTPTALPTVTPTPTPVPTPIGPPAGTIRGTCTWNNGNPRVNLSWSLLPPPNSGSANSNGLQKGDSFPNDPGSYWDFLSTNQTQSTYTDTGAQLNTQYQYRIKYRPDLVSLNTYNIFVSAENCGGPPPTPEPLVVRPSLQTVPPNISAFVTATGGTGTYIWSAPDGTVSGAGPRIAVTYTNSGVDPIRKTITVVSGTQAASAEIIVEGIRTFQDSIDLIARGNRYILINGDAPHTLTTNVTLTLSHGLAGVSDSAARVRLSNTLEGVEDAPLVPFQSSKPWNLCAGLTDCSAGLYGVFAIYVAPNGVEAPVVHDMIAYLINPPLEEAEVLIDLGAASTSARFVDLALKHGFDGIPEDEITMQIANDPVLINAATPLLYTSFLPDWNLCAGLGSICPNGQKFVYVKYCARGGCNPVVSSAALAGSLLAVRDDILLDSPWPNWGVTIDGNAVSTDDASHVQLSLNPFFDLTGTEVYISNNEDMLDAVARPFTDLVSWDLCYSLVAGCPLGDYTVYVRYINDAQTQWPAADSPVYQDDIAYVAVVPPPPGSAAILINGGAPTTASRIVTVNFNSPFGSGPGVQMRPLNEGELTKRDVLVIANNYGGGIDSQPEATRAPATTPPIPNRLQQPVDGTPAPGTAQSSLNVLTGEPDPSQFDKDLPELESGFPRPFAPSLTGWDLCQGAVECPFGKYRIYVQYNRQPSGTTASLYGATLAALGDEISQVYFDTVDYGGATPTPTLTPTPTVSLTPTPTPGLTPTPTGVVMPTPTPCVGPACNTCEGADCACTGPACTCSGPDCNCSGSFCTCSGPACSCSGADCECTGPSCEPPCTGFFCIFGDGLFDWFGNAFGGAEPVLGPLALVSAIVVALSAIITILPLVGPGLISFIWQWLLGAMGLLPARKKTWGTVYDSYTKRPIPYAKVQLLDRNRRPLETRVADKEGRYGFLTTPESLQAQNTQIYILPTATGYSFPSHATVTIDLFVYNNLYRGDLITVEEKTLINFDVPMDPLNPKVAPLMTTSPSIVMGAAVAAMADAGFWLGLIIVPLNFLVNPNPFTFGTMCLFLGTASLRLFGISEHPFGTVTDMQTGHAMPFALITLNDMTGKRVAFAVSDEQGRYFIVAERGNYELTVFTPATIQPTRQSKQVIEVKKGWVTRSIKV